MNITPSISIKTSSKFEDWSFAKVSRTETLWGPHGYHRYPAKFIPQLVRRIIENYSSENDLIGDPFLGSGTTGVEALRTKRRFRGSDINPVAVFISKVKCNVIESSLLEKSWDKLFTKLSLLPRVGRCALTKEERNFVLAKQMAKANAQDRFEYWFPKTQTTILKQVLELILEENEQRLRDFYLCAFSNILKNCSIWLSGSTKPQKDLNKILQDPIVAFYQQVRSMIRRNNAFLQDLIQQYNNPYEIIDQCNIEVRDARKISHEGEQLSLLVTSPPYATCYQYLELHQLTQLWFEKYGLLDSVKLKEDCIGGKQTTNKSSQNLRGIIKSESANQALLMLENLNNSEKEKAIKKEVNALHNYFIDMQEVIKGAASIVRSGKYFVLIIGDSYKRGITIPTSMALKEIAETLGFTLELKIVRKVAGRVLVATRNLKSGRFSSSETSNSYAYPEEDILIFKRSNNES